jgi:hypothetical protein
MQINKHIIARKQNQGHKTHDYLNKHKKIVLQNLTPFHDKSSEETRTRENITQH